MRILCALGKLQKYLRHPAQRIRLPDIHTGHLWQDVATVPRQIIEPEIHQKGVVLAQRLDLLTLLLIQVV
ncbi:MAG: hypothetical protein V8Q43_00560 [Christensenellaceae bacterium]